MKRYLDSGSLRISKSASHSKLCQWKRQVKAAPG